MTYCKQQIPDEFYIPTIEQVPIEIISNVNHINAKRQKINFTSYTTNVVKG